MKDYLIRAFFALITVGILLLIANIFNIRVEVKDYAFLVVVAIGGGWGGWYLYKKQSNQNKKRHSKVIRNASFYCLL
ncbi:hypothetical protein [Bacillus cereus]|uniref:hypothetical protein n=1 Tax=Bacillus cereus TaxID=1396 RepID=UPI001124CA6E|nr:hypothetical protein [Bacillus cereus]QDD86378.1 hypothetical protein FORC087_5088 [Bacillus cereus]